MYVTTIVTNLDVGRAEAEIADESGNLAMIVYEHHDGWHVEVFNDSMAQATDEFRELHEGPKGALSHYVNRRGNNPPEGLTAGALSLWLMEKDDGTAMGRPIS
jgi:hypothetical protein